LLSSLTLNFLKVITAELSDYHPPPILVVQGPAPAGPLLLKIIISQAHVDSCATVSHIRRSLTQFDMKMLDLDSNIKLFNQYVKAQIKSLLARGEMSSNLFINLLKGYKVAKNVEFLDCIRRKENSYEEGEDINPNYGRRSCQVQGSQACGQVVCAHQRARPALTGQVEQLKLSEWT
jgi:hypothetical protein